MAKSSINDPALRRLRALKFIDRRITGHSQKQVAEEFNVHPETVSREINWAKRHNLTADYEETILETLVPKAIKAFGVALDNNDAQAALEVLKGTGLLRKPHAKPYSQPPAEEDSLEIHIKKIGRGHGTKDANVALRALEAAGTKVTDLGSVLEGQSISSSPATPAVGANSDDNRTKVNE